MSIRLADYTEQAGVTDWPARIVLVLAVLALIALALWGMRRGWRNRGRRQAGIPAPAESPVDSARLGPLSEGLFVGTSTHGDWLDRIVVFDLGVRSRAALSWGPGGIWFERPGARGLFIPAPDVVSVRVDRGVAGTVRGRDSVIVVTWRLGEAVLDTGFRADRTEDHRVVLDGLMSAYATGVQ